MPRIRSIKPDFFTDDDLSDLPIEARLMFIGLWCLADREGRLEDKPRKIKVMIFPYDNCNADELLSMLSDKFIQRYKIDDRKYIQINNFLKHQLPHHSESPSDIPAPDGSLIDLGVFPTRKIRYEIYNRDEYKCAYCNIDMRNETRKLCLDHVIPLSRGGSNYKINLATSCKKCNAKKFNRTPEEAEMKTPEGLGHYADTIVNGGLTGGIQPLTGVSPGKEGKGTVLGGEKGMVNRKGKGRRKRIEYPPEFERLWKVHSIGGKADAFKAFERYDPSEEEIDQWIEKLYAYQQTERWREGYCPHLSTWINKGFFDGRIPPEKQKPIPFNDPRMIQKLERATNATKRVS